MLIEPQRKRVLDDATHKGGALPGAEALLGLAGELGLLHLDGQHVVQAVPDIVRRQLDAPGQQIAEFAVVPQRIGEAGAQATHVGAALGRRNQIDVGLA